MPTFGQKTSILSKIHIMDQKSQQDVLFYQFFTKKLLPNAHIYFQKEKRPFSKNTLLSSPFCRKNVHSLRNIVLLCHLKKHEKPPAVMPIFDQQTSILSKLRYYLDEKKSIGCPFFQLSRKNYCLMPIYIFKKKNVRSVKTHYSHAHFVEKTSILSETLCSYVN